MSQEGLDWEKMQEKIATHYVM